MNVRRILHRVFVALVVCMSLLGCRRADESDALAFELRSLAPVDLSERSETVRFLSFDENGALLLTDVAYNPNDTLGQGRYVYLQTIRAEVDAKMLGTYVWEFPVYMDDALSVEQKNQFARDLERHDWTVQLIQGAVSALDEGNGSKTTLTERGAVYTGNFYKLTVEVK